VRWKATQATAAGASCHPDHRGNVKKLQFACENDGGAASCQRDAAAKKWEGIAAGSHTVTLTVDSDDTAFGLLESNLQALRSVAYGSQAKKTERAMTLGKEKKKVVAAKLLEVKFNKKQQQIIDDLKIGKLDNATILRIVNKGPRDRAVHAAEALKPAVNED